MKYFHKYLVFLALLVISCESDDSKPVDIGLDYFPLQKGLYHIYTVDEVRYSPLSEPETLAYELRTEIVDTFPDTNGNLTYVIYRSTRTDANADWKYLDTWSAKRIKNEIIVNEGNVSYVKFPFPVKSGVSWDGNKYNNNAKDVYKLKRMDVPLTFGGLSFEKTLTIEQESNDDPIVFTDFREESYARGVGLILKSIKQLHYCTSQSCLGKQIVETGVVYKQQIKEYGVR